MKRGILAMKWRTKTVKTNKTKKQPKIASCGFVPGRACFSCPLDDCCAQGTSQSPDEMVMSKCGRFTPPSEPIHREKVYYDPRKHRKNSGDNHQWEIGATKQSKQWIEKNLQKKYGRKLAPVVASLTNRRHQIKRSVSTMDLSNKVSFGELHHEG